MGLSFDATCFLAAAIALTISLWLSRPIRSSLGLLVILTGRAVLLSVAGEKHTELFETQAEAYATAAAHFGKRALQ